VKDAVMDRHRIDRDEVDPENLWTIYTNSLVNHELLIVRGFNHRSDRINVNTIGCLTNLQESAGWWAVQCS